MLPYFIFARHTFLDPSWYRVYSCPWGEWWLALLSNEISNLRRFFLPEFHRGTPNQALLGKINEKRSTRSLKPARVVCRDTVETSSYKLELYWIEGKLASFPTRPRMEDGISKHLCGVTRHVLATSFHQRSKFASNTMDLVSWREIPVKILFIFFDVTLNDRTVCSLSKNKKGMLISYASLHREEDYVSNIFTSDQISSLSCFNPMNVLLILLINSCRESTYERYAFTYIFVASFFMKHLQIVWFYMNYVSILFNTNKCEEDYYRFGIATYCFRLF